MHGIDLVIREAGDAFALILLRFFSVLGGYTSQVLLPAVCALIVLPHGQLASFAVALFNQTATTATWWSASQPDTLAQACGSRRCQARTASTGTTT